MMINREDAVKPRLWAKPLGNEKELNLFFKVDMIEDTELCLRLHKFSVDLIAHFCTSLHFSVKASRLFSTLVANSPHLFTESQEILINHIGQSS